MPNFTNILVWIMYFQFVVILSRPNTDVVKDSVEEMGTSSVHQSLIKLIYLFFTLTGTPL